MRIPFRKAKKQLSVGKTNSNQVTLRDWVEAMRDGSHQYRSGAFHHNGTHCALGVLADLTGYKPNIRTGLMTHPRTGETVGGYSLGRSDEKLAELGIDVHKVVVRNDNDGGSYESVVKYLTCELDLDPDTVIAERK